MDTVKSNNEYIFVRSQSELEVWLAKHYDRDESIWLHYYKQSLQKSDLTYSKIVDSLLCYGWIDSLPRKVNDEVTSIRISPRNPKSNWSNVNKQKIKILTKENRMQKSGLAMVTLAKKTGTWNALIEVDNLKLPEDFKVTLTKENLHKVWELKSRSWKRGRLESLFNLKSEAARVRKIKTILNELK